MHHVGAQQAQDGVRFGKRLLRFAGAHASLGADLGGVSAVCLCVCQLVYRVPQAAALRDDMVTGLAAATVRARHAELRAALQAAAVDADCAEWLPVWERYSFALDAAECVKLKEAT